MQKAKVMEMSDFVIKNDGTLEQLHAQIEEFLKACNQ
jgi:dephospho-CoA kinase